MRNILTVFFILLMTLPTFSKTPVSNETEDYIAANTIAILYHELGHALIDVLNLPVLAKEEDAADILSVIMIDRNFEPEDADQILLDAASSYAIRSEIDSDLEPIYWDEHGLDLQRFYTMICLHYGADPKNRADFIKEVDIPDDRAEACIEERELAEDSWGPILDELESENNSVTISFDIVDAPQSEASKIMLDALTFEIEHLLEEISLPQMLTIQFGICDEANAFYIPSETSIVMCHELADMLAEEAEHL